MAAFRFLHAIRNASQPYLQIVQIVDGYRGFQKIASPTTTMDSLVVWSWKFSSTARPTGRPSGL